MDQTLEPTIADSSGIVRARCAGCLVKIHPLELDSGIVRIPAGVFTIGRDASSDLQVCDDAVSRHHATIEFRDGAYYVTDLDSTNGVYVNDEQVSHCELQAGDRLRCGSHIFKFLDQVEAQYHETVYAMMTRDGLTRAYNKRYFLEMLKRDVERCRRRQRPMSLVLLDIDHFKTINDQYGHLAGDEVLRELSVRIQQITRDDELFARYGGEEFALLISDGNLQEAVDTAERCHAVVGSKPFNTSGGPIAATVSVGVAEFDCRGTAEQLIEQADQKLYQAKKSGRNRVCS